MSNTPFARLRPVLLLLCGLAVLSAACTRPLPVRAPAAPEGLAGYYGAVALDGAPAYDGITIVVQVNGANCGSGATRGGQYQLVVAAEGQFKGCGRTGDAVVFSLGGVGELGSKPFDQRGAFRLATQRLDLTIRTH